MRILMTTRGSSGHLEPLVPIARAAIAAGHELMVAAQHQHRANVDRAGLAVAPVGDPPEHEWKPLLSEFARLDLDTADAGMIGDFFARIDTRAALPDLLQIVERWAPDVIVRESWEFASTIAAELHGIPLVRVGLGLAAVEERTIGYAAAGVDAVRADAGLPPDPAGDRLRDAPYLTQMPALLDGPAGGIAPRVHRFRPRPPVAAAPPAEPLVYLTLGSVTAGVHLPYFPAVYRAAIEALAPLPARVLVTIGNERDPAELGPLPPNVRVERWVPQDEVLPRAAAVICHGGSGTTLGALSYGVPLVVLPLFSADQWDNAAAVASVGAGIALHRDRREWRVLHQPPPDTFEELGRAARRVLEDGAYRHAAGRVAAAMRALPPVGTAVDVLAASAAGAMAPTALGGD
jgi:UDP:flavonoid glycosyltransferase YjiC (YdhE family)